MRILFWCECYHPYIGGVEVLGRALTAELARRGHDVTVLTALLNTALPAEERDGRVRIVREPTTRSMLAGDLGAMMRVRGRVAALKAEIRPDVIHLVLHAGGWFHLMTESAHRSPLVLEFSAPLDALPQGSDTVVDNLARRAERVTGVTRSMLDQCLGRYPFVADRARVIYNALPMPETAPAPFPAEPVLLCLGRVVENKGFAVALRAMPGILERFPTARMLIAGDGPFRPELEALAGELGLNRCVTFLGWVEPTGVPALINRTSLMIVPTLMAEPFGLVAVQAAQMGRPVVAARAGGLPEVVDDGQTGLIADWNSPESTADAVIRLLSDPDRAADMGRRGRERAQREFEFGRYVDDYEAVYREAAAAPTLA
jgi:glycogen(starch) synthase